MSVQPIITHTVSLAGRARQTYATSADRVILDMNNGAPTGVLSMTVDEAVALGSIIEYAISDAVGLEGLGDD